MRSTRRGLFGYLLSLVFSFWLKDEEGTPLSPEASHPNKDNVITITNAGCGYPLEWKFPPSQRKEGDLE